MKLNVEQITDEGVELGYREPPQSFDYLEREGELAVSEPVRVSLRAEKITGGVALSGVIQGRVSMSCSRCLERITEDISHEFSYDCLPAEAIEEEELSVADTDVHYYSGGEIDISALVQEQVALAIPMRPLCKEDCKGLCPKCGANLNLGDCGCKKEAVDIRFAALKDLKIKK
jgi:uncharacterized protein